MTTRIADLNRQIADLRGTGHEPNDLLDQRDTAINDLSQFLQVSTVAADDGSVSVFMSGGQKLVLGGNATSLSVVPDALRSGEGAVGITEAGVTRAFPPGFITGGSVGGLLRFQNHDLADARNLLGQMAVGDHRPAERAAGARPRPRPAAGRGAPLLSVGAPVVAPASTNAQAGGVPVASYVNGSGVRVSSVSITVVDSDALQPSDYELFADPALPAGHLHS